MIGNTANDLADLETIGRDTARRAAAGRTAASTATASDSSGTVSVTLNEQGHVTGVRLTPDARRVLGPDGIGAAVQDAAQTASTERLTAWAETFTDDDAAQHTTAGTQREGAAPADLAGAARRPAAGRAATEPPDPAVAADGIIVELRRLIADRAADSAGIDATLYGLVGLLERVERDIDEASERGRAAAAAQHTGVSADRHVRVVVAGSGELVAVRCDPRWVSEAHEVNIARQITSAFRDAYQVVARNSVGATVESGELGEIQRLLRDPSRLADVLRLGE